MAKLGSEETLDVFYQNGLRPEIPSSADDFREHIAAVLVGATLARDRKGLTRQTCREQVDFRPRAGVIDVGGVAFKESPMRSVRDSTVNILEKCRTRVGVPLDEYGVVEAGSAETKGKATGTGE